MLRYDAVFSRGWGGKGGGGDIVLLEGVVMVIQRDRLLDNVMAREIIC